MISPAMWWTAITNLEHLFPKVKEKGTHVHQELQTSLQPRSEADKGQKSLAPSALTVLNWNVDLDSHSPSPGGFPLGSRGQRRNRA